ncbi:protein kinase A regulatory subunit [Phycomyces blakesleeanus NRRL 1555(-)]|uniref:cAMP-dependent protein kinase regulatory subunit n=1 Tax=Phycomyces blakesleeanus (strain ATCC 8743b / DSM 1359 / FGSC 10004 / NBRC 33097 / NRRL 1555) TaxID=763407 RepID=A0A162N4P2_PHYB8|nr:protein kinase A regulatory subunit [Phycomyces blakesleeanus NRRL 1555(-)]OAD68508.1 protein kinase A regulatory subunit [Phycomyces blakesleeanus NRRL 1555(-)]|eukprot:XP_018286548.1 protein kinase A regulatory subunit [Phycomyces blakesleeanus NRRL 1555(-)]
MEFISDTSTEQEFADIIQELTQDFYYQKPDDVLQFCTNFFQSRLSSQRSFWRGYITETFTSHPTESSPSLTPALVQDPLEAYSSDEEDVFEDEDTFENEMIEFTAPISNRGRRTSVSAESMTPLARGDKDYIQKIIPKTNAQKEQIQAAIRNNFLFRNLDENQHQDIINAMSEKQVLPNEVVIQQGAIGDYFYIVGSGQLDCYINSDQQKVTTYGPGGSFGELALMYDSPRAATIVSVVSGVLWALDRLTFHRIVVEHASHRRQMYESFLAEVPILASLDACERFKVADALEYVCFEEGETVVQQNGFGDNFYLIESGDALVYQTDVDGIQKEVNCLTKGAYFGELALLHDIPRAATVIAQGRLRCATLGKRGFSRLLGPILDILKRNSENYAKVLQTTTI